MTFVLSAAEPLAGDLARILVELLTEAADRAANEHSVDIHTDVHEVRKSLKKARAVLKLVRRSSPQYLATKLSYREIGRALSECRDAAAVVESLEALGPELATHVSADALGAVVQTTIERRDAITSAARAALNAAADPLRAAAARAAELDLRLESSADLTAGLEREYRRGLRLSRTLIAGQHDEEFHSWRKRAKEHRYHLEVLLGEGTEATTMRELTDFLGRAQDVTVLLTVLDSFAEREELRAPLRQMRTAQQLEALELGTIVYSEPAEVMSARVLEQWGG